MTEPTSHHHDNDADLWLNLKSRLQPGHKVAQIPPIRWAYPFDPKVERDPSFLEWMRNDIQNRTPVFQILDRWLQHGIVDDSSEQLRWYFAARFEPAIELVSKLTYSKCNLTSNAIWQTFFPFPKMSSDEVLLLLLGEWWEYMGSHVFFDQLFDQFEASLRKK